MADTENKIWVVIPSRYGAVRMPGKPLAQIAGKPMIQRVWERAKRATRIARVVVATDDARIRDAVRGFGGEAIMTRSDHSSGTSRIAEVAVGAPEAAIFINVQGDEPLVSPEAIDELAAAIADDESVQLATLATPVSNPKDIMDPNIVKVVLDFDDDALYFSRAPIPWVRDTNAKVSVRHLKHLGLYAYRREALMEYETLPPGDLERVEQLEQLRWLENGFKIRVAETAHDSVSVDVQADVARVEDLIREGDSN
jgi:3-deoxy-manno-octulosonate cytidylyltransferase (CMP-KDO synthetase)